MEIISQIGCDDQFSAKPVMTELTSKQYYCQQPFAVLPVVSIMLYECDCVCVRVVNKTVKPSMVVY